MPLALSATLRALSATLARSTLTRDLENTHSEIVSLTMSLREPYYIQQWVKSYKTSNFIAAVYEIEENI